MPEHKHPLNRAVVMQAADHLVSNAVCESCSKPMHNNMGGSRPYSIWGSGKRGGIMLHYCGQACFDQRFPWAPYEDSLPWKPVAGLGRTM